MIISRTPLRVSFCGGGTDLPAYYRKQQGAVVSAAVNKYVYITVNHLTRYFDHRILLKYSKTDNPSLFARISTGSMSRWK